MATFVNADCILGASTITQIRNTDHKTGIEARKVFLSGGNAVQQVSGKMAEEVTTVTSEDLATLVALNTNAFCSAGLYVSSSTITVPYKSRSAGASFASGSNHSAISGATALIIPTSFEASQDGDAATCAFEIHWVSSNGTTAGATGSTGNALGTQAIVADFALGPAYINGTEIVGVQSIKINPGITLEKSRAKGLPRPTIISIKSIEPTIEIVTNDIDSVVATVNAFTAMTSANVYFRKREAGAVYSAAGLDCIRFTFAAGMTDTNSVSVSDNNNGTATVTLHGKTLTASAAVSIP
jgi:hypothetical protein